MKTILFPTDFSKASEAAMNFAVEIAKRSGAKIIVTHSYNIPVINLDVPPVMLQQMYDEEKAYSESEMAKVCARISSENYSSGQPVECEYKAKQSLAVSEIVHAAEAVKADLIVMGTGLKEKSLTMIGSTAAGVISKGHCPVLIVHETTRYQDLQNIHFAIENVKDEMRTVKQLTELASIFNAEINILHVEKVESILDYTSMKEEIANINELTEEVRRYANYDKISFRPLLSDNVIEGLDSFFHEHPTDLIVLLKHERGWLENLFHKSVIKNLLKKEELPILILNADKEE